MGFSIGSFLGKIAGPIIGGLVGGPAGAILGAGITAGFSPAPAPRAPPPAPRFVGSQVGPTAFFQPAAFNIIGPAAKVAGAVGLVAFLLSLIRERTGQRVTREKVVAAVKACGITLAAQTFQITETEICQIVISKPRRRGRGISAADMRRTRSTIRKVHNISRDLKLLKATPRRR